MLKRYFDDAILLEKEGYSLYSKLALEAQNKLSKKLFESLAYQEKEHIEMIKNYVIENQDLYEKKAFDSLKKNIHKLFDELGKKAIGKDLSQIAGIEKALEMEKKGYELYEEALKNAETEDDKKFLKKLLEMEAEHYESLANVYYYYTDNVGWLSEDESKIWNWMNI